MPEASTSTRVVETTPHRRHVIGLEIYRLAAMGSLFGSIIFMVTNNRSEVTLLTRTRSSVLYKAQFYDAPSFIFLVAIDFAVLVFSASVCIYHIRWGQQASEKRRYHFLLMLHSTAMFCLLLLGCTVATTTVHGLRSGGELVGGQPYCDHHDMFCQSAIVALLLSYAATTLYLAYMISIVRYIWRTS